MGKKRVTDDFNDDDKPPNHVPIDHHHQHHRHHNHLKPKKIKFKTKLLHSQFHLKKLAKYRSKNLISHSSLPSANISHENNKNHRGHLSTWLNNDQKDDRYDLFMDFDLNHDDCDTGTFEFGQEVFLKITLFLGSENNEDLSSGNFVFSLDLHASHNMVMVFEECGLGYGSYIPGPNVSFGDAEEDSHIYDMLKLSSQEDMINEFLNVNLFVLD